MKDRKLGLPLFLFIGVLVSLCVTAFYIFKPTIATWIDNKIYDTYLKNSEQMDLSSDVVIVDIDDRSLNELGQWPWPRYLLATVLENLTNAGAASIGMDILLSESDRSSPKLIKYNLKNLFGIDVSFENLPDDLYDNDILFADVLSQTPTILAMYINFSHNVNINGIPEALNLALLTNENSSPVEVNLRKGTSVTAPLAMFYNVANVAYINAIADSDGVMRKVPLIMSANINNEIKIYPNLALQTLAKAFDTKTIIAKSDEDGISSLRIGAYTIPVEADGSFYIKFKGKARSYKYISASDVVLNKFNQDDVAEKIIFLGSSAAGLQDIRVTPLDSHYPGVELHASTIDNILTSNFIAMPIWTPGMQVALIIILGLFIALLFSKVSPYLSLPFTIALLISIWYIGLYLFNAGSFVSPQYVFIVIILECLIVLVTQFIFEARQKNKIKGAFSRYVSPIVVTQIANSGIDVFKGSEREVTAMFTDIRGFTTISEKLKPEQVVELLNRYFTPMTALIKNSGGTLDKFIGDAIVAFWNAPLDVKNHPKKAIEVGINMQVELAKLNVQLEVDYGIKLAMGAGVNTGNVYVGNMGSTELLDYTIIGDNVNLTSRLEGLCSKYGVTLVVSENSANRCRDAFYFQPIDKIKVKGKTEPISVYLPLTLSDSEARKEELALYNMAHELYVQGEFFEAKEKFSELVKKFSESVTIKLYNVYLERCADLIKINPIDWKGIWEFTSK